VAARREGNRILYSIADPDVPAVLDLALCLTEETRAAGLGPVTRANPPIGPPAPARSPPR
jgi:hypothetical protein